MSLPAPELLATYSMKFMDKVVAAVEESRAEADADREREGDRE